MLFSFALVGLALGLRSLQLMQELVKQRFGYLTGWLFALTIAVLSGLGIYIGRFLRWNSWQIFSHPLQLTSDLFATLATPALLMRLLTVVLLFSAVTVIGLLMIPTDQVRK